MKVLMISGYKGSGKDAVADLLQKNADYKKVSLATALKDMVSREYGLDRFIFDDQEYKEVALPDYPVVTEDFFSRDIHKKLLTEFKTKSGKIPQTVYYEDNKLKIKTLMSDGLITIKEQVYWTPRALLILHGSIGRSVNPSHWVEKALQGSNKVVIADWRYVSEYDAVVKIVGKENVQTMRLNRYESDSVQESERNLDFFKFDSIVDNKGTLQELFETISGVSSTRRGPR